MAVSDFPTKGDDKAVSLRNSNFERFDRRFAERIKADYPEIWKAGGNIRGNEAFTLWGRALEGDDAKAVTDWIREREAWSARHFRDGAHLVEESPTISNVAGLVAQMKWGTVGVLGMSKMKSVVNELIEKMEEKQKSLNYLETREATSVVSSVNDESRTIEVTFGTTYPVQRYDGQNARYFNEVLSFDPAHVRMERMENGTAPVLNNHMNTGTDGVLGKVESARLEGDHGVAVLRFAKTSDVDNTWEKVRDGIISGVSVGYRVHEYTVTDRSGDVPTYTATSWEPLEVSIAPVPADPRSSVRSATDNVEIKGDEKIIDKIKEMDQRDAAPIVEQNKARKMNLNDLKASRKAMENELADLNALTEMDDVQSARFAEVVGKIDDLTKSIELKERAAEQLKARAVAGEAKSTSEEKEISKLKKRFSITESVRDLMDGKGLSGVAMEMKTEAARQGHHGQGIVIPANFQRAGAADDFQAGSGDGSGFVATEVGAFIEGLTAPLEVEAWGTQVLRGLSGNVQFPRESVKATATAEGEVDDDANSGMEMDELTLSPKRYANTTKFSKQLMYQATGDVEAIIANALRRGHERKVLSDIFTGSAGITGITGITGVNDIAAADTGNYAAIVAALEAAVLADHGLTPNARFVLSPSAYDYISKAVNVTGVSALIDNLNNTIKGYAYHKTPYLADASAGVGQAVFGDWANAVLAFFGAIDIVVDPYTAKNTAQVEITMNQFIDFNLTQPAAFAFENGITIS